MSCNNGRTVGIKEKGTWFLREEPLRMKILAPCGNVVVLIDIDLFRPSHLEQNSDYKTVDKCPTKANNNSILIIILITMGAEGEQLRRCPYVYCHHFPCGRC